MIFGKFMDSEEYTMFLYVVTKTTKKKKNLFNK